MQQWYVFYGSARMLSPPGTPRGEPGWALRPFDTEETAVDFAIGCVKSGLGADVGEAKENVPPKYRTADIARLIMR
jgi:hypothetical protein